MEKEKKGFTFWIPACLLVLFIFTNFVYFAVFNGGISLENQDWASYGTYVGGLFGPIATLVTLFWIVKSSNDQSKETNAQLTEMSKTNELMTKQLIHMSISTKMTLSKVERESELDILKFYLKAAEDRISFIRREFLFKEVIPYDYRDIIEYILRADNLKWVKEESLSNGSLSVTVLCENGKEYKRQFDKRDIWGIVNSFVDYVGEDEVAKFFKNNRFQAGITYMKSFCGQVQYLVGLLTIVYNKSSELNISTFIVRNYLAEIFAHVHLLKRIQFIDEKSYTCFFALRNITSDESTFFSAAFLEALLEELNENCVDKKAGSMGFYYRIDEESLDTIYLIIDDTHAWERQFDDNRLAVWRSLPLGNVEIEKYTLIRKVSQDDK